MWFSVVLAFVSLALTIILAYPLRRAGVQGTEFLVNTPGVHAVSAPYVDVRNATYYGDGPREEARAMCSVLTHNVNATANATISKRIYGVATPRDISKAVQRIELILHDEMQMLWKNIDALRIQFLENSAMWSSPRRHMSFRVKPKNREYWRK